MNILKDRIEQLIARADHVRTLSGFVDAVGFYYPPSFPAYGEWLDDIHMLLDFLPQNYPLKDRIEETYSQRNEKDIFDKMMFFLNYMKDDTALSIQQDNLFNESTNNKRRKAFDVFISHASNDKLAYVEELYETISLLGIPIFYDTDTMSWGDKWKERLLEGTESSEFAIIVISNNFFGSQWAEWELNAFLDRQNSSGQKIILPLLYEITLEELQKKYPSICDIQCIKSLEHSKEEIALLFAQELIKRLKGIQ